MVIATNNKGKLEEIRKILNKEVFSLKDKNIDVDVIEDADSFQGNATKKAIEIYNICHEPVIADDSGLCIDALDGYPGVMTHRFLGENITDEQRNDYLINEVNKYEVRSAKVICVIVYYDGIETIVSEGVLNGSIAKEKRGNNGFGFDEIFELDNGLTLAELSSEEKNKISARAKALENLKNKLKAKRITKIIVMPFIFVYSFIGYNINIKNKKEKIKQSEQFIIENKKHKQEANIHTLQYVKGTPKKEIKKTKNISLFKVINNEKKDKQENVLSKPITIAKKQASKFKTTKKVQELKNTKQKEQKSEKKIIVEIKPAQELKKDKLNTNDKSFIIDWVKIKIEELKKIDEEINELETQIKNCTNYKDTYDII